MARIRKSDQVVVLAGKDKGKRGVVRPHQEAGRSPPACLRMHQIEKAAALAARLVAAGLKIAAHKGMQIHSDLQYALGKNLNCGPAEAITPHA